MGLAFEVEFCTLAPQSTIQFRVSRCCSCCLAATVVVKLFLLDFSFDPINLSSTTYICPAECFEKPASSCTILRRLPVFPVPHFLPVCVSCPLSAVPSRPFKASRQAREVSRERRVVVGENERHQRLEEFTVD